MSALKVSTCNNPSGVSAIKTPTSLSRDKWVAQPPKICAINPSLPSCCSTRAPVPTIHSGVHRYTALHSQDTCLMCALLPEGLAVGVGVLEAHFLKLTAPVQLIVARVRLLSQVLHVHADQHLPQLHEITVVFILHYRKPAKGGKAITAKSLTTEVTPRRGCHRPSEVSEAWRMPWWSLPPLPMKH